MGDLSLGGLTSLQGRTLLVVTIIFYFFAIVAVCLRIWAKELTKRPYRYDDWLIFNALIWAGGFATICIVGMHPGGIGLHVVDVLAAPELGPKTIVTTLKVYYASTFVWITGTTLTKLSILYLYTCLFGQTKKFYYSTIVVAAFCTSYWLGDCLLSILQCRPIALNWDKTLKGHCAETLPIQIVTATLNMVFDLVIVILPMPVLWNLQMPFRKKLAVTCVLSLGLCICAMNVTRIVLEVIADQNDFTFSLTNAGLFAGLEIYIGIIVSCLPTLGPLLSREKFSLSSRQKAAYNYSDGHFRKNFAGSKRVGVDDSFNNTGFDRLSDNGILLDSLGEGMVAHRTDISTVNESTEHMASKGGINVRNDVRVTRLEMDKNDKIVV